jgi:hypothetical protein
MAHVAREMMGSPPSQARSSPGGQDKARLARLMADLTDLMSRADCAPLQSDRTFWKIVQAIHAERPSGFLSRAIDTTGTEVVPREAHRPTVTARTVPAVDQEGMET